jgi:putative flippase GtrA
MTATTSTTELGRIAKYAAVGVTNTLITLIVFAALTHAAGTPAALASAAGFLAGAVNGYHLNRRWTFDNRAHSTAIVIRYLAIQVLGAAVSAGVVAVLAARSHLEAEACAIPAATIITYTLTRRLLA